MSKVLTIVLSVGFMSTAVALELSDRDGRHMAVLAQIHFCGWLMMKHNDDSKHKNI